MPRKAHIQPRSVNQQMREHSSVIPPFLGMRKDGFGLSKNEQVGKNQCKKLR